MYKSRSNLLITHFRQYHYEILRYSSRVTHPTFQYDFFFNQVICSPSIHEKGQRMKVGICQGLHIMLLFEEFSKSTSQKQPKSLPLQQLNSSLNKLFSFPLFVIPNVGTNVKGVCNKTQLSISTKQKEDNRGRCKGFGKLLHVATMLLGEHNNATMDNVTLIYFT